MGQSKTTLARTAISVKGASSELKAPGEVVAGSFFKVAWTGPNNAGDFITIVKAGAEEKTWLNYAYTKDGNPSKLRALDEPGAYELRYITGQSRATLARVPLKVQPAKASVKKTE
jgi:Ca-activated chloride channel family protein